MASIASLNSDSATNGRKALTDALQALEKINQVGYVDTNTAALDAATIAVAGAAAFLNVLINIS